MFPVNYELVKDFARDRRGRGGGYTAAWSGACAKLCMEGDSGAV
jgi:hypothetical protein